MEIIVKSLWFFLPIGVANMVPVLVKRQFKFLAVPVSKRWLGAHKTWRGLVVGILLAEAIYLIQYLLNIDFLNLYNYQDYSAVWGIVLGGGALGGDMVKSFIKRRFGIKPGKFWFPFDQIDYTVGALILASLVLPLSGLVWLIIILSGLILHMFTNYIGYLLKIKEVPW